MNSWTTTPAEIKIRGVLDRLNDGDQVVNVRLSVAEGEAAPVSVAEVQVRSLSSHKTDLGYLTIKQSGGKIFFYRFLFTLNYKLSSNEDQC